MKEQPVILVSNDDGINAPGLAALVKAIQNLGDLIIVAPDRPQSGMGHAITVREPLQLEKAQLFNGIQAYQSSGTPADCVKLGVGSVLQKKPSLVVSGINHGSNSSINAIYSGTVSAAMEGAIEGIPAIAFSLTDPSPEAEFGHCKTFARTIVKNVLRSSLPKGTLLNVNIPRSNGKKVRGIRICRQAHARWDENFDIRTGPGGNKYYHLVGNFVNHDERQDTDEWALQNYYVSIVPIHYDLTAYHAISHLNKWDLNEENT